MHIFIPHNFIHTVFLLFSILYKSILFKQYRRMSRKGKNKREKEKSHTFEIGHSTIKDANQN